MDELMVERKKKQRFSIWEIAIIILLAVVPLFMTFPFRVNIFLSWEGAYRLSEGQIPYKDFGMPMGFMYWVIPAVFFKLFGVQMISLIKAQVFINILSGFAFRSILKSCQVQPGVRLLSVILYCISFSFFNFWPWYNHTVIVYEMIALAFLLKYIMSQPKWWWIVLSSLFTFFSFFTKQDGGGLTFFLCLVLVAYHCYFERNLKALLMYVGSVILIGSLIILPFTNYNFGYWFNYGQLPHTARVSLSDLVNDFFAGSQWIKFYLFLILLLAVAYYKKAQDFLTDKKNTIFLLLTIGILVEAAVLQVTSYTPPDNNIFYHSFAFSFILSFLSHYLQLNFYKPKFLLIACFGLLLWWSGVFWNYTNRFLQRLLPAETSSKNSTENIVNRHTYLIHKPDSLYVPDKEWIHTGLQTFNRIYMPSGTVDGIQRLMKNSLVRSNKNLRVLNMSELTPLAAELPYKLETGPEIPLWYHLGVSMFNKEANMYEQKIKNFHYDLVLFEYVPSLNNFYPFRVRDTLLKTYTKIDAFPAPRRGETQGIIEVFIKPQ